MAERSGQYVRYELRSLENIPYLEVTFVVASALLSKWYFVKVSKTIGFV